MFEIDDTFLQNIGYDVATLSDNEKNEYKKQITEELQARISDRLGSELEDSQVDDLGTIQDSAERADQWLHEFHADYESADDYKTTVPILGEDEAKIFYAAALWMQDAIPDYGLIIREEFDKYQNELIDKAKMVADALSA